jgi:hypothetical protein
MEPKASQRFVFTWITRASVVHFDPNRRKSGISFSRAMAIASAKYAIEKGLKALARVK